MEGPTVQPCRVPPVIVRLPNGSITVTCRQRALLRARFGKTRLDFKSSATGRFPCWPTALQDAGPQCSRSEIARRVAPHTPLGVEGLLQATAGQGIFHAQSAHSSALDVEHGWLPGWVSGRLTLKKRWMPTRVWENIRCDCDPNLSRYRPPVHQFLLSVPSVRSLHLTATRNAPHRALHTRRQRSAGHDNLEEEDTERRIRVRKNQNGPELVPVVPKQKPCGAAANWTGRW